jgi:hypothetical protein
MNGQRKLAWELHPTQINMQQAQSEAYRYTLLNLADGRAELSIRHRGDRPGAAPIKRFPYKNRNAAFGGAQRFEDKHGYSVSTANELVALRAKLAAVEQFAAQLPTYENIPTAENWRLRGFAEACEQLANLLDDNTTEEN